MSTIPFEKQHLRVNLVEQIERNIAQGGAVAGDELFDAIERSQGRPLDNRLSSASFLFLP